MARQSTDDGELGAARRRMRRGTAQDRLPAQGHVISGFESSTLANHLETLLVDRVYARPALFYPSADRPQSRLTLIVATLAALLLSPISAGADPLQPEIMAAWNSLPYKVNDAAIAQRWKNSQIFGKALIQGLKIDSRGNMYVTTARWGGPEIPATVSKLVKNGDTYELVPFPDEELKGAEGSSRFRDRPQRRHVDSRPGPRCRPA